MSLNKTIGNNLPRVKVANRFAIRETIYRFGPLSRLEVSSRLNLTLPTITTNVNSMIASGLVLETGPGKDDGGRGRKTHLIDINPSARHFIGLEIRAGFRRCSLTDLKGRVLCYLSDESFCPDYYQELERAASLVKALLEKSGFSLDSISGIGVAIPGLVDSERGRLVSHPSNLWRDKDVLSMLRTKLRYKGEMHLENNTIARAYGMSIFDAGKLEGANTLAYMYVSAGIACPLLGGVRLHFGSLSGDGEAGHMVMNPDGPVCRCGNKGCLEAYSSESAMIERARAAVEKDEAPVLKKLLKRDGVYSVDMILEAAENGSEKAQTILETAIEYLGLAIANIDNFVRPECIAVEARIFNSPEREHMLLEIIHRNLYRGGKKDPRIIFVPFDPYSGARGAAAAMVKHHLEEASKENE